MVFIVVVRVLGVLKSQDLNSNFSKSFTDLRNLT